MKSEHKVEVTLVLSMEEAQWLHGVMQNPLWDQTPQQESETDAEMRKTFFQATDLRYRAPGYE